MINRESLYSAIEAVVKAHGTQQAAAKALGVSGAYLSAIRHGRRELSVQFLDRLGYRRVVMYEQILKEKER